MPIVDRPLPELKVYAGRNPRPADFDAYWAQALRELAATDPRPTFLRNPTLSTAKAECFDLWFLGTGQARIHAKYVRPKTSGKHPAVLQFHGYGRNSGDWSEKLPWILEDFCIAALDCRGQGGPSEDIAPVRGTTLRGQIIRGLDDPDPQNLAFRHIFLDTAQLARVVMSLPEVDAGQIGCFGDSQGGALALACAALEPRIRRAASIYPFLCDYQRVWEMDLAKDAYEELRYFFRWFDPRHEREKEIFTRLGYIDCQHLAPRIQASVLMFIGLMDTICPPSTQFAAYNRITSPKEMVIYPDYTHEAMPGCMDRIMQFMLGLKRA